MLTQLPRTFGRRFFELGGSVMRLGITGANGFVGGALRVSARAAGWDIIGVVRSGSSARAGDDQFRFVDDPWSPEAWAEVFEDVDCVVHLIGRSHHVGEGSEAYDDYYRDNVLVSEVLTDGLARTPVQKVVYLSSIKAVGENTHGTPIDGNTVPEPSTPYGQTKLEAEDRFASWAANTSRHLVVLRPPLVYGPGVKGNFRSMLRIADSAVPLPIGSIDNMRSMVSLDNLCDVILASASDQIRGIHRLPVADSEVLSTPDVITVLRTALGRKVGIFRFPKQLLATASRAAGVEGLFRRISEDLVVDGAAAESVLGWVPRNTAIQSLVETARWYAIAKR